MRRPRCSAAPLRGVKYLVQGYCNVCGWRGAPHHGRGMKARAWADFEGHYYGVGCRVALGLMPAENVTPVT